MKRRLQVFVSSTYTDLVAERQSAVSAILKAGHIPAGMELFTSGDRSQMDTIKQWIDESDVYMLILGGRYGSVEPATSISYTELEYDYAVEQGKPLFAVVITDAALEQKVTTGGSAFLEKENPKELMLFRKKVLSNMSSFFDDPKDIKLCVHESMADFAANRELKGWVSGDEVTDTKPLFEEIRKLSEENHKLRDALAEQQKRAISNSSKDVESFSELQKVLSAIEVKIPASLNDGKEAKIDLFALFFHNKETFVTGVTNAHGVHESESFLFYNVCPKLQVHGLVENEKVAGTRYRRYAVTKQGSTFLAEMERRILLKERPKTPSSITGEQVTNPTSEEAKPTAKPATRKHKRA